MDNLVLSILVFNTLGLVALVVGFALAYWLPDRHQTGLWVRSDDAKARAA